MKKILFFIPTLVGRGAEKVLINLVNNLDREKFDITVLTLFNSGVYRQNLKSDINYKYIFKRIFRGNVYLLKLFSTEFLFKKIIIDKYDTIVSFLEGPTTRIVGGCQEKNVRLINWVHTGINNYKLIDKVYRNRKEFEGCYEKFDTTVFVSKTAQKAFENTTNLKLKSEVKYNLVEDLVIKEKAKEKINDIIFDDDKLNLISVGRLTRKKGYERLLKIYKKILEKEKKVHLYILGEGEEKEKLERFIENNKIEEFVTLLGYKDNPYKYVKNSDLFVCSSYEEGYSTAVTESIILGTPVITTLCSGMEELLDNGKYGVITENSDESLYEGLYNLINDKKKLNYYKKLAIERTDFYNFDKSLKEIENIL